MEGFFSSLLQNSVAPQAVDCEHWTYSDESFKKQSVFGEFEGKDKINKFRYDCVFD